MFRPPAAAYGAQNGAGKSRPRIQLCTSAMQPFPRGTFIGFELCNAALESAANRQPAKGCPTQSGDETSPPQ